MNTVWRYLVISVLFLSVMTPPVFAQVLETGLGGKLGCIGNHRRRLSGKELTFTGYTFRNFNDEETLTINSITIFAADRTILATMPPFPAGFTSVLGPNETTSFNTIDVFGTTSVPSAQRPLQVIVDWTADNPNALHLFGNTARQDRKREKDNDSLKKQRSRGNIRCVTIATQ